MVMRKWMSNGWDVSTLGFNFLIPILLLIPVSVPSVQQYPE